MTLVYTDTPDEAAHHDWPTQLTSKKKKKKKLKPADMWKAHATPAAAAVVAAPKQVNNETVPAGVSVSGVAASCSNPNGVPTGFKHRILSQFGHRPILRTKGRYLLLS